MAESYIVKIKFNPDNGTIKSTEKKLDSMFTRVTRKFRNGFKKALKGISFAGGLAAMGTALTALLNPMSQLNDRINATLTKAGNIKDRAQGAGTDIKTYLALQGYAASKGVNEEALTQAMSRMQVMVGEAKAGTKNALYNYRNETDMGRVFYNVMNAIAAEQDPAARAKLASDIFGQRAIAQLGPLVTEGFLKEDFNNILKGVDLAKVEKSVLGLDELGDKQAAFQFKREMQDLIAKGGAINGQTITYQHAAEKVRLNNENTQLKNFESITLIDVSLQKLLGIATTFVSNLDSSIILLAGALDAASKLPDLIEKCFNDMKGLLPKWLGGK